MSVVLINTRLRAGASVCRSCHRSFQSVAPRPLQGSALRNSDDNKTQSDAEPSKTVQIGLTNEQIPYRLVRLVDPDTNRLHPPAGLATLLAVMDRKTCQLSLVGTSPEPLVKLVKSAEMYKKHKEEQKQKKAVLKSMEEKEIQMTWGVDPHDFRTKLKQARRELRRGLRVSLVFAPRKGQPWLNSDGMAVKVQETVDQLLDAGKEWKPRDIQKATTIVYLQGEKKTDGTPGTEDDD
ncbi:unnamed protein product [Somion occarium]|uniref:Translation initiation factor 3 N-terminal domain-containing protein n=1 Tax=Somion occarium TaxID=3059160 RepID=A0ABP1E9C1_9APHY